MTPADHYHSQLPAPSKDCSSSSNFFNLNNSYHHHHHHHHPNIIASGTSANTAFNPNINTSGNHDLNNSCAASGGGPNSTIINNSVHSMGGQTPVFFPSSSFIVASHKTSQDLHDAMLASKQQLNRGAPLQLVDFKEVIGGGGGSGGNGGGGTMGEQMRMGKRPHIRFASGGQDYDPGPGSARSAGEELSIEYMDHMEGGDYMDHLEGVGELMKKGSRRLGYDQVKALEKAFEVENRLEPERKVRLASQLGLQPRQVAVWFQNRRARWKTKQMERDYTLLKNKFEALKADRDKLLQEKDHLQAELTRLKGHAMVEGMQLAGSKQATKGEQDSPTLASGSLVDDAAPITQQAMSRQGAILSHQENNPLEEELEEEEEIEEEEASPIKPALHEQKLLQTDSLSSTEDSDINNDGAIVDSTSKAFQEETDYYAQHWRLPPAPTQLLYKPTIIKSEEWPEQGSDQNMNSFSMPLDTSWYNW